MQRIAGDFTGKSIISIDQFSPDDIGILFNKTDVMARWETARKALVNQSGRIITNLFCESSTRTSASFEGAMKRLGGEVISITNVNYSSMSKGESLADTVRTLAQYSDAVVLRHGQKGSAAEAAAAAGKPVINAGDGVGEHPTQALLDLYTIKAEQGRIDGLKIAMVGDLRHGRTVHSLSKLLSNYGTDLTYVAPEGFDMPEDIVAETAQKGVRQQKFTRLSDCIAEQDVVYSTRIQSERFSSEGVDLSALQADYRITPEVMDMMSPAATLMHPFPRLDEIDRAVDADPRAAYFRQIQHGMHVRMALLDLVLSRT